MNEERKMILEMVKEGTVTIDEAEKLLTALDTNKEDTAGTLSVHSGRPVEPKRLHVLVTRNGAPTANIKIPFSMIKVGLKLGKAFGGLEYTNDPAAAQAMDALKNLDVDELLASITDGDIELPYTMVDVDDMEKGEHVTVILE